MEVYKTMIGIYMIDSEILSPRVNMTNARGPSFEVRGTGCAGQVFFSERDWCLEVVLEAGTRVAFMRLLDGAESMKEAFKHT